MANSRAPDAHHPDANPAYTRTAGDPRPVEREDHLSAIDRPRHDGETAERAPLRSYSRQDLRAGCRLARCHPRQHQYHALSWENFLPESASAPESETVFRSNHRDYRFAGPERRV